MSAGCVSHHIPAPEVLSVMLDSINCIALSSSKGVFLLCCVDSNCSSCCLGDRLSVPCSWTIYSFVSCSSPNNDQ